MPGVTPSGAGTAATPIDPATAGPAWAVGILQGLGAPVNTTNLQILSTWAASEGTTGSNNPLAVSTQYPGATNCIAQCGGSSPIMAYATVQDGVNANVAFLKAGGYGNVISSLQQTAGMAAVWAAVNQSGWCRGCQGGKYPIALYNAINSPGLAQQALSAAESVAPFLAGGAVVAGSQASNAASAIDSVGGLITEITSAHFWQRVGLGALGLAMIGVGLVVFFEGTDTGKKITRDAGDAAAVAAVA